MPSESEDRGTTVADFHLHEQRLAGIKSKPVFQLAYKRNRKKGTAHEIKAFKTCTRSSSSISSQAIFKVMRQCTPVAFTI